MQIKITCHNIFKLIQTHLFRAFNFDFFRFYSGLALILVMISESQAQATQTTSWFLSLGKKSNKVVGLSRTQKNNLQTYRLSLGKTRSNEFQVDLSKGSLNFPNISKSSANTGQFKVIQFIATGKVTKLFYFNAPKIDQLTLFDECLITAESKKPLFVDIEKFKRILDIAVPQRKLENVDAVWNDVNIMQVKNAAVSMTADWEAIVDHLYQLDITSKKDCSDATALKNYLAKEPRLSDFKIDDHDWGRQKEKYPILPVTLMSDYLEYWIAHRDILPDYFYGRIFAGPMSMVKTKLETIGDEKYRNQPVEKVRAEFKLGLLSLLAKPVFEFWLGKENHKTHYTTGDAGSGEPFESFLVTTNSGDKTKH